MTLAIIIILLLASIIMFVFINPSIIPGPWQMVPNVISLILFSYFSWCLALNIQATNRIDKIDIINHANHASFGAIMEVNNYLFELKDRRDGICGWVVDERVEQMQYIEVPRLKEWLLSRKLGLNDGYLNQCR